MPGGKAGREKPSGDEMDDTTTGNEKDLSNELEQSLGVDAFAKTVVYFNATSEFLIKRFQGKK